MHSNLLKHKIISENASRMKVASLIFVGFSGLAFLFHILKIDFWVQNNQTLYLYLDIVFAFIAVVSFTVFWLIKPKNKSLTNIIIKIIVFLVLAWSAVITGIDMSSIGFSTYMLVLISCTFFIYLELFWTIVFYLFSYSLIILTLLITNQLKPDIYLSIYTFSPIVAISILLSRKNFQNKYKSLMDNEKLEEEIQNRTKALSQSEEKLREILNSTSEAIVVHDAITGKITECNDTTIAMYGYNSKDEMLRLSVKDISCEQEGYGQEQIKNRLKNAEVYGSITFEWLAKRKNGAGFWVEVNLKKTQIAGEGMFLAVARDISEQKKNQEETSLLAAMLEIAPNSITVHDDTGRFLYANQKTFEIHDYSREEFLALNLQNLDVPESAELIQERINAIQKNGSAKFEVEHYKKDGSKIPLEVYVKFVNWKGIRAMLSIATDISERKKSEQVIKESEQRLALATQSAELGIWDWNVKENIMTWDEKMFDLYGIKKDTFVETVDAWMNGLHPDDKDRAIAECNDSLKGIKDFNTTFRVLHPDGKVLHIKADGLVLRDSAGIAIRMIGVNRDITESKLNETELIKAKENAEEANKLKTKFLNNMSHEIRTPMNGIIGFSEMLDSPDITDEERKYFTGIIKNSSQQLLRIIDDILAISALETRQEKINESEFCLNELMSEIYSIFNLKSKERNIPLYLKKALHDDQSYILSDKTKLHKILSNLLENALKFTNDGFIEIGYWIKEEELTIYVKDTGIGISQKNHEIIFERFSQEEKEMSQKYGGLGLGLSISKEHARLLGGDITLESEKGKGSKFFLVIPYKAVKTDNYKVSNKLPENSAKKGMYTILVAEDEEINYLYIKALFDQVPNQHYILLHAKNGKEAVDLCFANANIDIVLMDIKMPIMTGHEATEKIKKKFPNLPIIAQTAYSTESDKQLAFKHGCDDFISKPINKENLFGMIDKFLSVR
jgi:PAS domain S-box-containing protein